MKWLRKFKLIVETSVSSLRERFEDPERMLHHLVLEMEEDLICVKRNVATAIADQVQLERRVESARTECATWATRAESALRKGDEQLARRALEQRIGADSRQAKLSVELEKLAEEIRKLEDAVRDLEDKIRQAKHKKTLLLARLVRADSAKRIHEVLDRADGGSALREFARLESRVERAEAMCEAYDRLDETLGGQSDLTREFDRRETEELLERELDSLRRKLGE